MMMELFWVCLLIALFIVRIVFDEARAQNLVSSSVDCRCLSEGLSVIFSLRLKSCVFVGFYALTN